MRKVAVTGIGIVSPVGNTADEAFGNLMAGKSGVRRITADFAKQLSTTIAAEVFLNVSEHFSVKQLRNFDRTTQLALIASGQAWGDSGIALSDEERERSGVYFGTGLGGAVTIDEVSYQLYKKEVSRISPLSVTKIMSNASASHISIQYGLGGPCLTFSTACSSSAVAIGEAYRHIKAGFADVIVAGGTESLVTYSSIKAWESLGVLALEDNGDPAASCKPFSNDRTGFVLGEGSAVVVLEEMERAKKRGATIYGEVAGYGSTADACHITGPSIDGQVRAIRQALEEASLGTDAIDYINAHGTATSANDVIETLALKKALGGMAYSIPVSSTKSMHGHLMGAAGAVEFVITLLSIANKAVPPTAHLKMPDPECDLDYVPNTGRTGLNVRTAMTDSFAFGGTNAVLIVRKV